MENVITLQTDKPMPAFMTIPQTAVLLFGDETAKSKKKVTRMLAKRILRKGYGGGRRGSDIYIKTSSIREVAC